MDKSNSNLAQLIAQVAGRLETITTGRTPKSATVVIDQDTVVITLRGTMSPAEITLAKSPQGEAKLRELHRELFRAGSKALRRNIEIITGVEVREATSEVETSSGTVVHVVTLARNVHNDTWSGTLSEETASNGQLDRPDENGGIMND